MKNLKIISLIIVLLTIINTSYSQVSPYSFTTSLATYTEITGGTLLGSETIDDQRFVDPAVPLGGTVLTGVGFPIGFNIVFNGNIYDRFAVNTNGWISLGNSSLTPSVDNGSTSAYTPLGSTAVNTPTHLRSRIAALARDLQGQTGSSIRVETIGTLPNRVLVVQWKNFRKYTNTGDNYNFQIRLYETTNVVEVVYGGMLNNATVGTPQVGLGGTVSTDFSNRSTTTNWSATTSGTLNTATCTISATVFPANGLVFQWTPASCYSPTGLSVTGITMTGGNLSWVAPISGTPIGYQWEIVAQGTGSSGTIIESGSTIHPTVTATSSLLSASTTYDLYIRTDCGAGDFSNWAGPFTFTTACGAITQPYSQNFDGVTTPNLPACWSKIVVGVGTPSVGTSITAPSTAPNCAALYNSTASGSSTHILLITPQFSDLPTHTTQIRFKAKFTGTGSPLLHIGTMSDPANQNTFVTFQSLFTLTTVWQEFVIPFSGYAGVNQYIAFKHGYGTTLQYIYIDDVVYETIPTCPQPSGLTASSITDVSAILNWTSNGTESLWNVQWGLQGFALGTGTMINGITAHPYNLNGLTATTNYSYYVQADCGSGDLSSWSGPYTFTTTCAIYSAPFAEHFNTTTIPNCWAMSGPQVWLFTNTWPAYGAASIVGTDHSGTGGSFAGVDGSGSVSLTGINLLSPPINTTSLISPQLRFFLFNNNTNDLINYQTLSVDVYDGASWNNGMFTWGPTQNNAAWQEIIVQLNTLTITGPIQVRFVVAKSAGSPFYDDLVIDDVYIEEAPTCLKPNTLTATNITDLSADLGWTAVNGETSWDIQFGTTGFVLGTGTILNNVTTNPFNLTGLSSFTNYQYYVLAQCSPTDSSIWNGPFSFSTLITQCSGVPVPGVITSSINPVCPGVNFNLYLGGYNGGTTFQWQSSTNGITFTNIAGATNDTISVNQSAVLYYQCIVTCTTSSLSDTTTVFTENINSFINCYCNSNATSVADEEILNVTVGTLNNTSTCATTGGPGSILNEYSNFTAIAAPNLSRTLAVNFSVQIGTCGGNYSNGIAIWVDYNQNGLFTDLGEKVYNSPATVSGPHTETGSFIIPITATLGNTRMRVISSESSVPTNPCGTYTWGETEDYTVNISPAPTCIQPTALNVTNLLDVSADLGWTNGSTETMWDVQYGPTGFVLGTGTIVNNVTTNPYNVTGLTATTAYQFYVLAQCSPTDSSFWSGPFSFTTQLTICTGIPVTGTISSSVNPVCPGVNFNVHVAGYTIAGGVNFQWQNSSDGITFANIAGATNDTLITSQLITTYYQCIVTCVGSGLSDTTAILTENINPFINCYCTSNATTTADEEIFNVTVGTLNNTSTCATVAGPGSLLNEYSNFTAITPPYLSQSTTVTFSVHVNTCGATNYNSGLAIFIDYNQNGLFTDPGEKVYSNGALANITCVPATIVTGSFVIPVTATLGNTRMRVIDAEGNSGDLITPCLTYGYGETEDYIVNISVVPTCIQPTALTAANITSNSADIGWTASNGETIWDIQYGPSGFLLGTGTILNNITTNPLNLSGLSPASSYQFYVSAQCSPTDSSFWSGPFTFSTLCGAITPAYYEPLTTYLPNCWSETNGQLLNPSVLTGTTSNWISDGYANSGTTGSARLNVYSTGLYAWLMTPQIDLGTGSTPYQLEFDLALTDYASTGNPALTGTDDKFAVVISTNGGTTWSSTDILRLWDNASSSYVYNSLTPAGIHVIIPLTSYTGVVKFGFYGESTLSNADNDLFVDNIRVRAPVDLSNTFPIAGTYNECGLTTSDTLSLCVKNVGPTVIPAGQNIYAWYQVDINPPVKDTITLISNLLPNDSICFDFSQTFNFSALTTYLVNYWISYSDDANSSNDTTITAIVNSTLSVGIQGGDTVHVDPIFLPYTLATQATAQVYDTYFWSNSDGSVTGTTPTFDAPALGWYYLTVTGSGCIAFDSIYVDNLTSATINSFNEGISVYPNPTNGKFIVEINSISNCDYRLELISADGRKINTKIFNNVSRINEVYNETKLSEGIYYLKISGNNKQLIHKVVIY